MLWRAVLLIILLLRPVWAQDVAGASDPEFQAALGVWLADDEALALPQLAGLAGAGNPAAQLLLGLIDKGVSLQGPWVSALPRAERLGLMRAPGGISGTSWLRLAVDVPQAALWRRLLEVGAEPGIVLDFALAGEPRAARVAVLTLRSRYLRGWDVIGVDPDFPASMRFALWEEALPQLGAANLAVRAAGEAQALTPGDPQRGMAGIDDGAALESWVQAADVAEPVDALCLSLCPETFDTCAAAAIGALGGYRGLVTLGSPAEALVSTSDYAASARGRSDLLRKALLRWSLPGQAAFLERAKAVDGCFGAVLEGEAARY